MKASLEHLPTDSNQTFFLKEIAQNRFDGLYHFHPELELTLIVSGEGKRFVGNQISDFGPGDLVLLGENVPHCWQNNRENLLEETSENASQAIVIQFPKEFLGGDFLHKQEFQGIKNLMERAKSGFSIIGITQDKIAREMLVLKDLPPFQRLISFLNILQNLSQATSDLHPIDPSTKGFDLSITDLERINKVYAYVIANYTQEVHLDEVAHLANMTETAFCRYFKKTTGKTFVELVIEFRIKHACQMLRKTSKTMVEICFESGFGNLSHFNKQFKEWMKVPPLQYRKMAKEWEI
ncbi:AraC family transcriptional regulator [Sandaracinomonas limnophila]|uniref:AraC family transcriptional regulator n=1 Tax=Sandaracinomonas limnophila TaxID=1862386 RepID=A0A437PMF0_9BACT|nr:AraC family transcriptional regulator [Sandaracinomonas limnophila]RVU23349.1 AraC family transcriptional regulator [Sandaracinomonas limnophila]